MKLLYIHNGKVPTSYADVIQVLHMCHAFVGHGVELSLAVPDHGMIIEDIKIGIEKITGKYPQFNIILYKIPTIQGKGKEIGTLFGVRQLLKKLPVFDYYFARSVSVNTVILKFGYNSIFEAHTKLLHKNKLLDSYYKNMLLANSRKQNQVAFVSISNALNEQWIAEGVPAQKTIVLHDGFSIKYFKENISQQEARRQINFTGEKKIVLYSGGLYKNRNIESLLDLAGFFPNAHFLVLGGPDETAKKFQTLSCGKKLGNIEFLGLKPHTEVKYYLFAADVLLMIWSWAVPTISICSPLKVFEYMAAGRIIVGQAFPTIKEVLSDGENAFLADPDEFEDLKAKLNVALKREYPDNMADNARLKAFENYSWEKRTEKILSFISAD